MSRSAHGDRPITAAEADDALLAALIVCGCPADLALKAARDIAACDPEAAVMVSGYLARGLPVPAELTARLKAKRPPGL